MKDHQVEQGECLSSIADAHGFFWQTLWNHPQNAELKKKRTDPNVLLPGDVVHIPDKRLREERVTTGEVHRFRMKNIPAKLQLQILRDAEPRVGETFVLSIDKVEVQRGTIPASGHIEISMLPQSCQGELIIGEGENAERYILQLGHLDPIDTISGVKARLNSIGFDCGAVNDEMDAVTIEAITAFQAYINHPNPNGVLDAQTRHSLAALHDGQN
jgi:hypothetical protein